ncbi:MAG: Rpn family recombination-promoting nuclease/putative transposase [Propionibacteriaceae bacterium]|jgi:predicted transposase/invertase (TIGR01784 family)|nr:Rpn family recombination-promoting nuclease/putative transposase [Propionibacteriaceae bacterium]
MAEVIPPRTDLLFKHIFGDEENKEFLIALLRAVLDLPADAFARVELLKTQLEVESGGQKGPVLDVRAQLGTGEHVDVEIQLRVTRRLPPRIAYYTARMLAEQLHSGERYDQLGRAVTVLIVGENLSNDEGYHHRFLMSEPATGKVFSDALEIDTLELRKVPQAGDGTQLWKWMRFIAAQSAEELDMAAQLDPVIAKAADAVRRWSEDDIFRLQLAAQEKVERDYLSRMHDDLEDAREEGLRLGLEQGLEQGLKQGLQQGIQRGKNDGQSAERTRVIRHMLSRGLSAEDICGLVDVSISEVSQIQRSPETAPE